MNKSLFEQFAEDLYRESPRGAYALESMKYGIMARTGLPECDALEVACRIVLTGQPPAGENSNAQTRPASNHKRRKT